MIDNTSSSKPTDRTTKSKQAMFLWALFCVAGHLLPTTLANTLRDQTTYRPVPNQEIFHTAQPANVNIDNDELFVSPAQPQSARSEQNELWLAGQKSPVPFRASVPYMARFRERYGSATAPRRSDQGPGSQTVQRSEPAGILEEDIDVLAAEDGAPPTETVPLYECPSSYRATPDGDGTTFQIFDSGRWWTHNCQSGLVWDQTLCRCEYPPGTRWELDCRDFRSVPEGDAPGSFQQYVNGAWMTRKCSPSVAGLVWDQDSCRCVWGPGGPESVAASSPCDIMLNMTFDHGVEDTAKGSFVEVGQGLPLPTRSDPEQGARRGGNRAAYFTDTALNIWYFSDNDMGSSLRLEFRFLQDNVARSNGFGGKTSDNSVYQMFLSNGCNISAPGYVPPSVAIGYRASDHSYLLAFETSAVRKAIVCSRPSAPGRWHSVSLLYEDGTLVMRVDGQPCVVSADFSGPIQKSPCPLTIGSDPLDRQGVYKGYLDDLLIARNCRDPSETSQNDQETEGLDSEDPVPYRAKLQDDTQRAKPHRPSKDHLAGEQRFSSESGDSIDGKNEMEATQSPMNHHRVSSTESAPYKPQDRAVQSERDNGNSEDLEEDRVVQSERDNGNSEDFEEDRVVQSERDNGNSEDFEEDRAVQSERDNGNSEDLEEDRVVQSERDNGNSEDFEEDRAVQSERDNGNSEDLEEDRAVQSERDNGNSEDLEEDRAVQSERDNGNSEDLEEDRAVQSERDNGNSEDFEVSEENSVPEANLSRSPVTNHSVPMSIGSAPASVDSAPSHVTIDDSEFEDNTTKTTHIISKALDDVNGTITVLPILTEMTTIETDTDNTNNNNSSRTITDELTTVEAVTVNSTTLLTSRPQISLFRAAVGGKLDHWQRLGTITNGKVDGVGFPGNDTAESLSTSERIPGTGGLASRGSMDEKLVDLDQEGETNVSTVSRDLENNTGDPSYVTDPSEYHKVAANHASSGLRRVKYRKVARFRNRNAQQNTRNDKFINATSGRSGGLVRRRKVEAELGTPNKADNVDDTVTKPMDEGIRSVKYRNAKAHLTIKDKELNESSISTEKDLVGQNDAGTIGLNTSMRVEDTNPTAKVVQPRKSARYVDTKQVVNSNETSPELYSNIKYRPPSERKWYEYVRDTQPMVSYKDDLGRVRYSYKARDSSKSDPHTKRNPFYSKQRFARKSNQQFSAAKIASKNRNRRDRRRRVPVIVMKRWYD